MNLRNSFAILSYVFRMSAVVPYEKFTNELRCLQLIVCKQFLKMAQIHK